MFEIMLISHGNLAQELLETAKLIAGEKVAARAYGLYLEDSIDAFALSVNIAIEQSLDRGKLLVLTDIQSGSPFNIAVGASENREVYHITGMNLPLVIEALGAREYADLETAFEDLVQFGGQSVVDVNRLLREMPGAEYSPKEQGG